MIVDAGWCSLVKYFLTSFAGKLPRKGWKKVSPEKITTLFCHYQSRFPAIPSPPHRKSILILTNSFSKKKGCQRKKHFTTPRVTKKTKQRRLDSKKPLNLVLVPRPPPGCQSEGAAPANGKDPDQKRDNKINCIFHCCSDGLQCTVVGGTQCRFSFGQSD